MTCQNGTGVLFLIILTSCSSVSRQAASTERRQAPDEISWTQMAPLRRPEVQLSSQTVTDGSVVRVSIRFFESPPVSPPRLRFREANYLAFSQSNFEKGLFESIIGIPYDPDLKKTKHEFIELRYSEDSEPVQIPINVKRGNYRSEVLKVKKNMVWPSKEELKRINKERVDVTEIYGQFTEEKFWEGPLVLPVKSKMTSPFGTSRTYNKKFASFHKGLDLRAYTGTPIRSAAGGNVVLARNLYYTGNTVIVDHGYGIMTLYAHLSKFEVTEGLKIYRNGLIGLAGKTGRVNGPHLHWGAIVNSIKVNPNSLRKLLR